MSTYQGSNPLVIARIVGIGVRIERRRAQGKSTRALEKEADRIIDQANERESERL